MTGLLVDNIQTHFLLSQSLAQLVSCLYCLSLTSLGDFIFPLKPSFKLSLKPNFRVKPN